MGKLIFFAVLGLSAYCIFVNSQSCPEKNGRFSVPGECDSYIECIDGVGTEKLCPDGLVFNDKVNIFTYPCQYPVDVDCGSRTRLQPAQPTEDCPHQFGYFKLGSRSECGSFMNCVDGRGYRFECPEGLAFSSDTYRCDWPDESPDCDASAYLGFDCPEEDNGPGLGSTGFRTFRKAGDCQRYFLCVNGHPRVYNCGEGNAFNTLINACDGIENVTDCIDSRSATPTNGFKQF